jgi:hypothetical protein
MSESEINVAIAELCGWKKAEGYAIEQEVECWCDAKGFWYPTGHWVNYKAGTPPPFCTDLNAMHEAERSHIRGNEEEEDLFILKIKSTQIGEDLHDTDELATCDYFLIANATARQRAEAFLRVKGKWIEPTAPQEHQT